MRARAAALIITLVLFALMLARLGAVVSAQPVLGYADSLDFFRQSSCVGLWRDHAGQPLISAHLQGPVAGLTRSGEVFPDYCMHSSDNLFAHALRAFVAPGAGVAINALGMIKLVLAAALSALCLAALDRPVWRLAVALFFLAVYGDVAFALFFNTLYTEVSLIIMAATLLGLITVLATRRRPPPRNSLICLLLCLGWIGSIKPQTLALAPCLGLLAAVLLWRRWGMRAGAACALAVALAAPVAFELANRDVLILRSMDEVNRMDSTFSALLVQAPDPDAALAALGLPPACKAFIGEDFYSRGPQIKQSCPEVLRFSRARLLPLLASQPALLPRMLDMAISNARPLVLRLNHVEGGAASARADALAASSASAWLDGLAPASWRLLAGGLAGLGLVLPPLCLAMAWRRAPRASPLTLAPFAAAAGITAYFYASAVFGDGHVELQRHALGAVIGLYFWASAGAAWAVDQARRRLAGARAGG